MSDEQAKPSQDPDAMHADPPSPAENVDDSTPGPESAPPSNDDKNMAMLVHLLGAFTGFLGPLIIWLVKKDESAFVDQEGKESLNFQITAMIIYVALVPVSFITCGIGSFLYVPVFLAVFIFAIVAALKAKDGNGYRYPLAIRLIK
ncbi:MAG: DUF4870 domain-containing protein [Planctomycetota bacterium]